MLFGEETQVTRLFDESGVQPSGGEGQKLAIARAIYKNAPVMIMDEPTAALGYRIRSMKSTGNLMRLAMERPFFTFLTDWGAVSCVTVFLCLWMGGLQSREAMRS